MDSLMILETLSTKGLDSTKSWQSKTSQWPLPKPMPSFFYSINFDPIFTCPHILRLGGAGDGPKWTCDPHRLQRVAKERRALATNVLNTTKLTKISIIKEDQPQPQAQINCLIYSVGCAGIYKWEEALARSLMEPGQQRQNLCEIHVFDFTKDNTVQGHVENFNIHFHPWGLKSTYDNTLDSSVLKPPDTAIMLTLPDMMKRVGHTDHVIDIFKVDCESCEWFSYRDGLNDTTKVDIRQLLLETHNLPEPGDDPHNNKGGHWFPAKLEMAPSQFFDDIERSGFAMYSKEPLIHPISAGNGVESHTSNCILISSRLTVGSKSCPL